jgi:hypothetical protein
MTGKPQSRKKASATKGRGLLPEDYSDIRLIPAKDRDWWLKLSEPAKARFAERHRQKWTDEETERLVLADPDADGYYELGASMGRSPGALRTRRSQMIHLLRDEYGYVGKAKAYLDEPSQYHKWADIGQVYATLQRLGFFGLPVHEQFAKARHLKQPSSSWRGDGTDEVLREQRVQVEALQERINRLRRKSGSEAA